MVIKFLAFPNLLKKKLSNDEWEREWRADILAHFINLELTFKCQGLGQELLKKMKINSLERCSDREFKKFIDIFLVKVLSKELK